MMAWRLKGTFSLVIGEQDLSELLTNANAAVEVLKDAAFLNLHDSLRAKNLLEFPNYGQLVMTGDMHGNIANFDKLRRFCDLKNYPTRHVILHELIHRELESLISLDDSIELLLLAAEYKCEFPEQVHFLQSNHELSQLTGNIIVKMGRSVLDAFDEGVTKFFGAKTKKVLDAVRTYIASLPLGARTHNRIFCSHSLPGPRQMGEFDAGIFTRDAKPQDWLDGDVYRLVWGRNHTREGLDELAQTLGVDVFIVGHTPQEGGHNVLHDRMLILASDHAQGVFLPFDLAKPQTLETLTANIRKFNEVVM